MGGIIGGLCELANQVIAGEEVDWTSVAIEAAAGAATGVLLSVGAPAGVVTAGRAFINGNASVAHSVHRSDDFGVTVAKASASMGIAYVSGMKYNIASKVQDSGVLEKMGKVGQTAGKLLEKVSGSPSQGLQTTGAIFADVVANRISRGGLRLLFKISFSRQRHVMI